MAIVPQLMMAILLAMLLSMLPLVDCGIWPSAQNSRFLPSASYLPSAHSGSHEGDHADGEAFNSDPILRSNRRLLHRGLEGSSPCSTHGQGTERQNPPSRERGSLRPSWRRIFSDFACGIPRGTLRQRHGPTPDNSEMSRPEEPNRSPPPSSQTSPSHPQSPTTPEGQESERGQQRPFVMAHGRPPRPLPRQETSKESGQGKSRRKEEPTAE